MTIRKKFFAIIILFCLMSCGEIHIMDNPTSETVNFEINGEPYSLPPKGSSQVRLKTGEHTLKINGKSIVFKVENDDKGSIINPTNSKYKMTTRYYGHGNSWSDGKDSHYDVDGYYIRHYVISEYSQGPWDYGLDEDLPYSVTVKVRRGSSSRPSGASKSKISRK